MVRHDTRSQLLSRPISRPIFVKAWIERVYIAQTAERCRLIVLMAQLYAAVRLPTRWVTGGISDVFDA